MGKKEPLKMHNMCSVTMLLNGVYAPPRADLVVHVESWMDEEGRYSLPYGLGDFHHIQREW